MANTKAHTQYRLKSGTLVPGVTTVLSVMNKPALVQWAYNCGRQGIDINKVRDQATGVGTLTHDLCVCSLTGKTADVRDYTQNQIDEAQNSLRSFYAWHKTHPFEPKLIEEPLVSETYGYGGTLDLFGIMDDRTILIDLKTSKSIYSEYLIQVAAYGQLLFENKGMWPDKAIILRINKGKNDDFEIKSVDRLDKYFEIFRHLLRVYALQKELG